MKSIIILTAFYLFSCGEDKPNRVVTYPSCSVKESKEGATIECPDGSKVNIHHGNDGEDGQTGDSGSSCSVKSLENGARIFCEDGSQVVIYDGEDGKDGKDAGTYAISDVLDPCGDNPKEFDQIILKTTKGEYISYMEDKGKKFLTKLDIGTYQTNDRQKCTFTITENNDILW